MSTTDTPSPRFSTRHRRLWFGGLALFALLMSIPAASIAWQVFSPRPVDTTDPAVLERDGASLDYCALPQLDNSGSSAADIPKAFTPDCGWSRWPMPVLANCTEPLADGVVDMRGLWRGTTEDLDHVERIEQCGNRVVVTAAGVIHDFVTDDTLANGAHDVRGAGNCQKIRAAISWRDGVLSFRPFGLPTVLVKREFDGDQLVWTYPGIGQLRMDRICAVPPEHR